MTEAISRAIQELTLESAFDLNFTLIAENYFALIKGSAFAIVLAIVVLIQWKFPYKNISQKMMLNWRRNLGLALVNSVLLGFLCASCVCAWSLFLRDNGLGLFNLISIPVLLEIPLTVVILDFVAYFWHWMNHRNRFLWRFHQVHHSDLVFEASTAVRFHLGELMISLLVRLMVVGFLGLSVIGLLVFEIVYQFMNIFEHGNISLGSKFEERISRVFVVPALHRKHHSVRGNELNSNYATIFSFWDRIFGTKLAASSLEKIQVGLPAQKQDPNFLEIAVMPFQQKTSENLRGLLS